MGVGKLISLSIVLLFIGGAESKIWSVGDNDGWTPGVNYTHWVEDKKFHKDDYLYFVFDSRFNSVVQVKNGSEFSACFSSHPVHNWTGSGRILVPLDLGSPVLYFISGEEGYCYSGLKLSLLVSETVPPPASQPNSTPESLLGSALPLISLFLSLFLFLY